MKSSTVSNAVCWASVTPMDLEILKTVMKRVQRVEGKGVTQGVVSGTRLAQCFMGLLRHILTVNFLRLAGSGSW